MKEFFQSKGFIVSSLALLCVTKEIFPVIIPLLFSGGISPAWCGYLSLPWH